MTQQDFNIVQHNAAAWDEQARAQHVWSQPVTADIIAAAKAGQWQVHITKQALSEQWLPKNIKGKDILCLASAGGQQAPVLAAAGANVTVVDISEQQLAQDCYVAKRDDLALTTLQADMADLSAIADGSFDYIIHPISNLYVPDLAPVWRECYRVLRSSGVLMASFYNPILFVFDKNPTLAEQGLLRPKYALPYADIQHLDPTALNEKLAKQEAVIFGHTLTEQIQGQLAAGFLLSGFYEDEHPSPRFLIERYMATMIATRAVKP
jgi:ubiquinone/menaquinone biosynthesis C-methylase UbiE